jgi:zinc D-Ala-D-Ala dipeptidase
MQLVEITPQKLDVDLDLRYAGSKNFLARKLYHKLICYLHPKAAQALENASQIARSQGYRLSIYDAFRPQEVQRRLWQHIGDARYIANPDEGGSMHSRGVAVDLSLVTLQGTPLDMGCEFDDFTPKAAHNAAGLCPKIVHNRLILAGIMASCGWQLLPEEWWHYELPNAGAYPLLSADLAPGIVLAPDL